MERHENTIEKIKPKLVEPDAKYKDSYMEALKEYNDADGDKLDLADRETNFDAFLEEVEKNKNGQIVEGVPQIKYWAVQGDRYIGNINYRPHMNDKLKFKGGNVGYSIRPSERGKGYASLMLQDIMEKAKADGMTELMLTADLDNVASIRVIEKFGGKKASEDTDEHGVKFGRFVINLID